MREVLSQVIWVPDVRTAKYGSPGFVNATVWASVMLHMRARVYKSARRSFFGRILPRGVVQKWLS